MCCGGAGIVPATCTENCTGMIGMWLLRWMLHTARTSQILHEALLLDVDFFALSYLANEAKYEEIGLSSCL